MVQNFIILTTLSPYADYIMDIYSFTRFSYNIANYKNFIYLYCLLNYFGAKFISSNCLFPIFVYHNYFRQHKKLIL